jgi:hypothetical protein
MVLHLPTQAELLVASQWLQQMLKHLQTQLTLILLQTK